MAEGPQVLLRARWLDARLAGRTPEDVRSPKSDLAETIDALRGLRIERVSARGKHIFVEFEGGMALHNHLRMDGRWREGRRDDPLLPGCWIAFDVGATTVQNVGGEILELVAHETAQRIRTALGPDVMDDPFPTVPFTRALRAARLPIAEALLDQAVVCGLGNTARCEALFVARVDPRKPAAALSDAELDRLARGVVLVTRESLRQGGRWTHRVYQRAGMPCLDCGTEIERIALAPSRRTLFVCRACCGMPRERDLYA